MRRIQNDFGSLYSCKRAIMCLILGIAGIAFSVKADSEIKLSSPSVQSVQQNPITVTGIVKDDKGEPVIGANVAEKGVSGKGTVTNMDGHFTLNVRQGATLTVSYIGFITQNVPASKAGNIILKEDLKSLKEVVVVGFGKMKKVNLTGAVASVSGDELSNRPVSNTTQALQGVVAGLQITQGAGSLDDTPSIDIRGTTTIGQGTSGSPLVLIDGMEGDINTVNPQDIQSISVLKDAASSAIYGSRAPFGVILITTKEGSKNDKVTINYSNNLRSSSPIRMKHMMNSVDFASMMNDAFVNEGQGAYFPVEKVKRIQEYMNAKPIGPGTRMTADGKTVYSLSENPSSPGYWLPAFTDGIDNTDWYDEVYKKHTFAQQHNISANGGSDKLNYYASFGYLDQDGLIKVGKEDKKQYNVAAKISSQWTKWLKFNYSMRFIRSDYKRPQSMGESFYTYLGGQWPLVPLYDRNGYYVSDLIETLKNGGVYKYQNDETSHQVELEIEPIKDWITHLQFNYRITDDESHTDYQKTYFYDVHGNPYTDNSTSGVTEDGYKDNYYNFQAYSDYNFNIKKDHHLHFLAGFQAEDERTRYIYLNRDGIIVPGKPEIDITTGLGPDGDMIIPGTSGNRSRWTTAGFFGRINYNYKEKYLLEMNGRYDGSSRFRRGNQWKFFPSISAGWNIASEKFMEPLNDIIGQLKLRLSYGSLGNQNTDNLYQTYQTISFQSAGGQWTQGGMKPNIALAPAIVSEFLTWEKIESYNVGLDFAFLKDRLHGSFDYYVRNTKDMVGNAPELPAILGADVPVTNNTDLRTKGWELTLGWDDHLSNGIKYGFNFNISDSRAKITKYPNNPTQSLSNYIEGQYLDDIYGFQTIGIAKTNKEMQDYLQKVDQTTIGQNWGAGDIMYADLNGDGKISYGAGTLKDHGDEKKIGNSTPRYQFGIGANASWKGFDFQIFFQGVMKRDYWVEPNYLFGSFDAGQWYQVGIKEVQNYFRDENSWSVKNGFEKPNTDAYLPRTAYSDKNELCQTKYLQNAAYIRLKNLQFGYTLPQILTRKWGIEKLRIYFSGENLWTGTSLAKQFDPETIGTYYGNGYPLSSTFAFGLSLTL
ncbi:MAG: TonB-dependent receptor [Prevotella sp.]|nr:TonB-dependent receptor [Prevotella sp.]MCH3994896.1 TonB-dependent receptor [Prevotella sp.]MCI1247195.1 TonB-dependent receptor [Prevotella sp.]